MHRTRERHVYNFGRYVENPKVLKDKVSVFLFYCIWSTNYVPREGFPGNYNLSQMSKTELIKESPCWFNQGSNSNIFDSCLERGVPTFSSKLAKTKRTSGLPLLSVFLKGLTIIFRLKSSQMYVLPGISLGDAILNYSIKEILKWWSKHQSKVILHIVKMWH